MKIHTYFSFHSMKTCDEKNFDDEYFNSFMSNKSRVGLATFFFVIATASNYKLFCNRYSNRYSLQPNSE